MRIRLTWLTEQIDEGGSPVLVGFWGDAKIIVEPTGETTRGGRPTWQMWVAPSPRADRKPSENVAHAQRRISERRANAAGASE